MSPLINVIPVRPRLGEVSGFASASYGDFDALNLQGALNVPLGADVFVVVCTVRNAFGVPTCPTVPLLPVTDSFSEMPPPFVIPPADQARPIGMTGAILTHPTTPVNAGLSNGEVTWRADIQYLDSKYDSFVYTEPLGPTGAPPLRGCPTSLSAGIWTINCSGFPAFNAPKWTMNLGAQQTFEFGSYQLIGSVDTQYKTKRYVQVDFLPQDLVSATWTTNAQIAFGPNDESWQIAAFVRNIENDRVVVNVPIYNAASSLQYITTAPRTYGVRVGYRF